jgi:DNA-binding PadR family transcriptional regulator
MGKMTPISLAVLGLLGEQPRHPYEIAFVMRQRHMDKHIRLNLGTLYHTFEQLQRAGWIEPTETERSGRRPERTVYALTPTGVERFHDRLRELIAVPVGEYSSFEAGLSFMHQLPREEAVELLRTRAQALEQDLDKGVQVLAWLRGRGLARLALIEVEMVHEQRKWQLEWVRRITTEIESGDLEWFAGFSEQTDKDEKEIPESMIAVEEEVP